MNKKRIVYISKVLVVLSTVLHLANEDYFNIIPVEISGYLFWLCLGFFLGTHVVTYYSSALQRTKE